LRYVQIDDKGRENMAGIRKHRKSKYDLRNKSLEKLDKQLVQVADENKGRKLLQREMREMALHRVEQAARTTRDFEEVVNLWDLIDSNRAKLDGKYLLYTHPDKSKLGEESKSVDVDKIADYITVYPPPYRGSLNTKYWRQVISGNFFDSMFDCAYEVHQTTSQQNISRAIEQLNVNRLGKKSSEENLQNNALDFASKGDKNSALVSRK